MGFVAFSWSRLSSDVCYDTCPAWGPCPCGPRPRRARAIERVDPWNPSRQSGLSWRDTNSSRKCVFSAFTDDEPGERNPLHTKFR